MPRRSISSAAWNRCSAKQYDVAETEFKAAVAIDPLYDAAFYGLGQVYMATKRYADALKAYLASRDAFKSATAAEALAGSDVRSPPARSNRCVEGQRTQHDAADVRRARRSAVDRSGSRSDPTAGESEEPPRRGDAATGPCGPFDGNWQRLFPSQRSTRALKKNTRLPSTSIRTLAKRTAIWRSCISSPVVWQRRRRRSRRPRRPDSE